MPSYRFSWDAFDDTTIAALAEAIGYRVSPSGPAPRAWLAARVLRPNDDFVRTTKPVLERYWLPQYPASSIVERLLEARIGPLGNPKTQVEHVAYIRKCRNSPTLRRHLLEALLRFGDKDRDPGGEVDLPTDPVRRFAILRPPEHPVDLRRPHSYQLEAWERLSAHLAESESTGCFRGLLVMPTGSGKTYTAVHWLLRAVVARGGRVLWLAHRHELLNQAAASFYALAGLVTTKERLRVRIVSRDHCLATQIDPADDILVGSIGSLSRRPNITQMLLDDPERFVVVDEAHHAPMKSYRDIIESLAERSRMRILGLTATPTRTVERERPVLSRLFGGHTLLEVPMKNLVERRVLARPIPVRVETGADVEAGVTGADLEHLARFDELSEEWLERIASLAARNRVIVDHYDANRARYGKALMFAINVMHAALLSDELRRRGIAADYVTSYRPDATERSNEEIVREFREPGGLQVLVNVQILTEGVDVPAVQSVFLTRPTSSEILLRQMIGRGLRGPAAGGTEQVYLVSFEDHWERFREWQSPLVLVPDIIEIAAGGTEEPPHVPAPPALLTALPWEIIRACAAEISSLGIAYAANVFEAVHHGWLVLERVDDGQEVRQHIAVHEHQLPCWRALSAHLSAMSAEKLARTTEAVELDRFFYDCDSPKPPLYELRQMLEHFRAGGDAPEYHEFAERRSCDPYEVARVIWDADLGERKKGELLEQRYSSLARAVYPSLRDYRAAVEDALYELAHPDEANRNVPGIPIFQPRPEDHLTPGPCHDLPRLMAEMLAQGAKLLDVVKLPHAGVVEWSRRLIKGWYGKALWEQHEPRGHGRIKINCLLDSRDVPVETIRFLLWHEYLHLYLQAGHTPEFRKLERRWPSVIESDRVLDNLNERFGVQYW